MELTRRETEVLELVAKGCTCRQIAERLFISYETAKKHMKNAYRKLGARNKLDALKKAELI